MKKRKRIREAGSLLMGLLLTTVFGCLTSLAYESASLFLDVSQALLMTVHL